MPRKLRIQEIEELLPETMGDQRFIIRYGRYSLPENGRAFRGQRDSDLLNAYLEGLDVAYATFLRMFGGRGPELPIRVLVFHLLDCLASRGTPTSAGSRILLSNRSMDVSLHSRMDRARVEAAHELFHIFQNAVLSTDWEPHWSWAKEATAVYASQHAFSGSSETCFFCQDWLENPEEPLDALTQQYASAMFFRWLGRKFGDTVIGELWIRGKGKLDPIDVLDEMAADRGTNFSELFREYSRDGYFLCDPSSGCYYPTLHALWGTREIREKFSLPADSGKTVEDGFLPHLSSNYFTIQLTDRVGPIEVLIRTDPAKISVQAALVRTDLRRGKTVELVGEGEWRAARLPLASATEMIDHFVITVTNHCRGSANDGIPFELVVRAVEDD